MGRWVWVDDGLNVVNVVKEAAKEKPIHVVIWSGGADSTLLLTRLVKKLEKDDMPVMAVSFVEVQVGEVSVDNGLMDAQKQARDRWMVIAKAACWRVELVEISYKATGKGKFQSYGQAPLWIGAVAPILHPNSVVHLGFIKHDCFWHHREQLEKGFSLALDSIQPMKIVYDLEWCQKSEVLEGLKDEGIPNDCWWSCERPQKLVLGAEARALAPWEPCGKCAKCLELKEGRDKLVLEAAKATNLLTQV